MDIGLFMLTLSLLASLASIFKLNSTPNFLIGYRTKQSMSNDQNWRFAQKNFFPISFIFVLIVILFNRNGFIGEEVYTVLCLVVYMLAAVVTEYMLYKKNRK